MRKSMKGITLVALVITIVILLILAGISIQAISNTGLFANAKRAKDESMKGQLQEEISLAIQSIQTEEIYKGNSVTLETLAGGQLDEALTDITAELDGDEINGEYKNYEYTIDSNLKVTINGEVSGAKITGTAEVQTAGYVFEGSTVDVKVTANVTEGTITGIVAPEGATLKTDTSTTEKVYTVSKSGTYIFKVTTDSGKTKNIKAKVNNILSAPQIRIDNVTWNSFRINVENDYPEGAITEYRYSVGGTVKQQGTIDKSYTVIDLEEDTQYTNIKVIAYINSTNKESNTEKVTTEMKNGIAYTWSEIAEIAKAISNDSSITDNSEIATVNGKTLKVGQMKRLDGKKVRILGFNHDTLSEPSTAYGSATKTGKAGISFEYVDLLTSTGMNSSETNVGGWKDTEIRARLNGTIYNSLSIKENIKKVKKDYIITNSESKIQQTDDYLWLLSCGEIWNNGYNGGISRGYAIATEGKQYKYYKINLGSTSYSSPSDVTKKVKDSSWWLRSPCYNSETFNSIDERGICRFWYHAAVGLWIAPSFSI
ncbi:hypothetical protein EGR52_08400 [bacterium]|nr:hypothetical protein [bacterium]